MLSRILSDQWYGYTSTSPGLSCLFLEFRRRERERESLRPRPRESPRSFSWKKCVLQRRAEEQQPKKMICFFFKLLLKFGRLRKLFNDFVSHVSVFPNSWTISFTIRSACALPPSAALEPGLLLKISNRSCMGLHRMSYMHGCFLSCFTILTVSQLPPTMDQYLWRSAFLPMLVQRHEHESSGSLTETRMIWTDFNCNCQYHKYITI